MNEPMTALTFNNHMDSLHISTEFSAEMRESLSACHKSIIEAQENVYHLHDRHHAGSSTEIGHEVKTIFLPCFRTIDYLIQQIRKSYHKVHDETSSFETPRTKKRRIPENTGLNSSYSNLERPLPTSEARLILENMEEILELLKNQTQNEKASYAQVTKSHQAMSVRKYQTKPPKIVIIENTKRPLSKENILHELRTQAHGAPAPDKIDNIRKSGNKIIIECKDQETQRSLIENFKQYPDTRASEGSFKKPMLTIKNLPADTEKDKLLDQLNESNPELKNFLTEEKIKIVAMRNLKSKRENAICIASGDAFQKMHNTKINLIYEKVTVEEYDDILQCYHCLGYGHMAKYCRSTNDDMSEGNSTCPKCGQRHKGECASKTIRCINCHNENERIKNDRKRNQNKLFDEKHTADNKNCPVRKSKIKYLKSITDYSNDNTL